MSRCVLYPTTFESATQNPKPNYPNLILDQILNLTNQCALEWSLSDLVLTGVDYVFEATINFSDQGRTWTIYSWKKLVGTITYKYYLEIQENSVLFTRLTNDDNQKVKTIFDLVYDLIFGIPAQSITFLQDMNNVGDPGYLALSGSAPTKVSFYRYNPQWRGV